jgi:hypothetical protein
MVRYDCRREGSRECGIHHGEVRTAIGSYSQIITRDPNNTSLSHDRATEFCELLQFDNDITDTIFFIRYQQSQAPLGLFLLEPNTSMRTPGLSANRFVLLRITISCFHFTDCLPFEKWTRPFKWTE